MTKDSNFGPNGIPDGSIVSSFVPTDWKDNIVDEKIENEERSFFIGVTTGGGGIYYTKNHKNLLFCKNEDGNVSIVKNVLLKETKYDDIGDFILNNKWALLSDNALEITATKRKFDERTYPKFAELELYGKDLKNISTDRTAIVEQLVGVLDSGIAIYYYGLKDRIIAYTYNLDNEFVDVASKSIELNGTQLSDYIDKMEEKYGWKYKSDVVSHD